jgi:acetylornithine deacetylase/succinyl-diaminopimelate desuccinylase-like protein
MVLSLGLTQPFLPHTSADLPGFESHGVQEFFLSCDHFVEGGWLRFFISGPSFQGRLCECQTRQVCTIFASENKSNWDPGDHRLNFSKWAVLFSSLFLFAVFTQASQGQIDDATKKLSHDIFKQLIEINTTDSVGNVTTACEAMAHRFRDAGFADSDMQILGPNDRKKNLVVRLHGTGKHKPLLLIGHLDVVEAHREDWTIDPFTFVEKDGFYYGRGTQDMKNGDAIMATTLIRFKKEGFTPDRDIILALTADEEGGKSNGVDWLVKNHRDLIDAEMVFNHDGGGILSDHGKPVMMTVDATEKLYADFQLSVTNPGGHSSLPRPDNAIYSLANALTRLEHYQFPFELNEVTRVYYERMAKVETPERAADMRAILKTPPDAVAIAQLSRDPIDNSTLHTTCVATRLDAGHANNALPQRAEANVNCRILPGHSAEEIRQELIKVFADPAITVRYVDSFGNIFDTAASSRKSFPPPPLRRDVFGPLEKITEEMWPGTPVIPDMATGASDGVYTMAAGLPTYQIAGTAIDRDDIRAHGRDERLGIESYYKGVDFYYRFLKAVTSE